MLVPDPLPAAEDLPRVLDGEPDSPASCIVLVVPGGTSGFDTVIVRGATGAYGWPVVVFTRRPSLRENMLTVIEESVADSLIRSAAGQSFRKISSGPPQDTVASRPIGYREM